MIHIIDISLGEILEDDFFCFSDQKPGSGLGESISRSGIRTPVCVIPHQGKYRLLSGFKRIAAARELGMTDIPAELAHNAEIPESFLNVIHEQITQRALTLIEKSRIIGIFEQLHMDQTFIVKNILPVLSLPDRKDLFSILKVIRDYHVSVQKYLEQYDVSLKKALMFSGLTHGEQELMIRLAEELQLRSLELSEIIDYFIEIGRRESVSVQQVFESLSLSSYFYEASTRNEKIVFLKTKLKERRTPKLIVWRRSLEEAQKKMNLPSFIRIKWDLNLESPGIELKAHIQSTDDLKNLGQFIQQKMTLKLFQDMLKIV